MELSERTLRRWCDSDGNVIPDQRPLADKKSPGNKLTQAERDEILRICNSEKYASLPPSQIVPKLADEGIYIASESSFYRTLMDAAQQNHRGRAKSPTKKRVPTTHIATAANQVWTWDISYISSTVTGRYWYLYLILDIFSRKIVGWEIYDSESGEFAKELLQRTIMREQCFGTPLVLHSDNGAPMKSLTFKAKMDELGILSSYSRPRVSNDNPYSESAFRTIKYSKNWPSEGFESLTSSREWMQDFVEYYNNEHSHSGIKFVTPAQRHMDHDIEILKNRDSVYKEAQQENPGRWSGSTRNWTRQDIVTLNPERLDIVQEQEKVA